MKTQDLTYRPTVLDRNKRILKVWNEDEGENGGYRYYTFDLIDDLYAMIHNIGEFDGFTAQKIEGYEDMEQNIDDSEYIKK